jgi:hypothetical protein
MGCATQRLDLSRIKQADPAKQTKLTHFEESGYSVYMLFDLIPVSPVTVDELMARANPGKYPVANLQIKSKENIWATLVNILNGGVIDRGIIVSLNNVTVEGDIVQP